MYDSLEISPDENDVEKGDEINISFDCPVCDEEQEHTTEYPVYEDEKHHCSNCYEKYFLLPVVSVTDEDIDDIDLYESIEQQLYSISIVHTPVTKKPGWAIQITDSPGVAIASIIGLGCAFGSFILLAVLVQGELIADRYLMAVFFGGTTAMFMGIANTWMGPIASLHRGYLLYQRFNPDVSFSKFVLCIGNYYHNPPV